MATFVITQIIEEVRRRPEKQRHQGRTWTILVTTDRLIGLLPKAERMMRKVGAKMLKGEQVRAVQAWRGSWEDAKQAARAENTMRKVGAKMLNGEQVRIMQAWRSNCFDAKQAARAERMMRRVGAKKTVM